MNFNGWVLLTTGLRDFSRVGWSRLEVGNKMSYILKGYHGRITEMMCVAG